MHILSYVPPYLVPPLAEAVRVVGANYLSMHSWAGLEQLLQHQPADVIVVDPCTDNTLWARKIVKLMRANPAMSVIGYTRLGLAPIRVSAMLVRQGLDDLILFRFDDGEHRLSRLLLKASTRVLTRQVLAGLQGSLKALPPDAARAVKDLFEHPAKYQSARDLVPESGVPLTSLYRAFYMAGLYPPKRMFIAAKTLHALSYLRDPEFEVQQVAAKLSYRHPRVMTQHTLAVFGKRPSALRRAGDTEQLVQRLLRFVQRD